jgi:hypothetical protein
LRTILPLALLLTLSSAQTAAETLPRDMLEQWVEADQVIDRELTPGMVFVDDDITQLKSVLPPGYIDAFQFPGARIEIQESGDYVPYQAYLDASDRHSDSSLLAEDGSIEGHIAGLPFSHPRIRTASEREAGYMVAWNNIFRWHYYGYRVKPVTMYYVQDGSGGAAGDRPAGIGGDAAIRRSVEMWFHRVYLNRLAMLPESGYTIAVSGSDDVHYKDFMEITAPFDVAGAKFIIERSLDPYQEDQVNSYLPTERRVRRLSAQERADSFLGSDYTFDDFEGFSGRVMDYDWHLVGEKSILAVVDSKHERVHVFGPQSRIPDDHWQLRDCYVVRMVPRWDGHPYGAKYVFFDKQTWLVQLALIFNREGQHWKTLDPIWQYPEMMTDRDSPTATVGRWRATIGVDLLKHTATVSQALQTDIPDMKRSSVRRLFDVSALNEGR